MTAARLEVEFAADLANLNRSLADAKTKVAGYSRDVEHAANKGTRALERASTAAAIGVRSLVGAAAGFGAVSFAGKALDDAAAIDKLARAAGMTTQAFQQLQLGAKANGFTDDIGPALAKFADNAQLARSKMGELYETLKFASPALAEQISKTNTTAQALELYAEAVRRVNGDSAKAVLVKKAFGESADALVPILSRGAAGLAEMRAEAEKLTPITDRAATAAKSLKTEVAVLATEATNNLANVLAPALERMGRAYRNFRELGGMSGISKQFAKPKGLQESAAGMAGVADQLDRIAERANELAKIEVPKLLRGKIADDGFDLSQKPDYRGDDAVQSSVASLAAARGEVVRMARVEADTTIENARRLLEERVISEQQFARIRANTNAATEAKIVELRRAANDQMKGLEVEALQARDEGFEAIRVQMDMELAKYRDMVRAKVITEADFAKVRENLNAVVAEKIKAEYDRLNEKVQENTRDLAAAFESAFGSTLTGQFDSASDAARNFGQTLLKGLQDAITKALILEPLMKSIRGGLGNALPNGIGGLFSGGGAATGAAGSWAPTVSYSAEGGALRAGQASNVNERAGRMPEVFIPDVAGRVVPGERARAMGGSGAGGSSNVYNIDARGAGAGIAQRVAVAIAAAERERSRGIEQSRTFAKRYPMRA